MKRPAGLLGVAAVAAVALLLPITPAAAAPIPFHGQTFFGGNGTVFPIEFFDPDSRFDARGGFGVVATPPRPPAIPPAAPKGPSSYLANGVPAGGGVPGGPGFSGGGPPRAFVISTAATPEINQVAEVPAPSALLLVASSLALAIARSRRR